MNTTGRSLPHSLEAELHLISCCLLDGADVMARCMDARIRPDSFYDPKHGTIFQMMLDLYNAQKPTDVQVVAEELQTSKRLDSVGGWAFLAQVSSRIPTTAQAGYFIEKVREQAMLRELIRSATGIVEDCYGFTGGIEDFTDAAEKKLFEVTQNRVQDRLEPAQKIVPRAMEQIQGMINRRGDMV